MKRTVLIKLLKDFKIYLYGRIEDWSTRNVTYIDSKLIYDVEVETIDMAHYDNWGHWKSFKGPKVYRNVIRPVKRSDRLELYTVNGFKKTQNYKSFEEKYLNSVFEKELIAGFFSLYSYYQFNKSFSSDKELESNLIDICLKQFKRKKYFHKKRYFVQGLIIKTEKPIRFKYNEYEILIRIPTPVEFAESHYLESKSNIKITAIIEVENESERPVANIYPFKQSLSDILLLYKCNSFAIKNTEVTHYFSKTSFERFENFSYNKNHGFRKKYYDSDSKLLKEFVNQFSERIKSFRNDLTEKDTLSFSLKLALDNYRDCLLTPSLNWKKRIMQTIMGLESIWLTDQDKETIGYKLKLRLSSILEYFEFDSIQISKNISIAYSIRSSYAHGSPLDKKLNERIDNKKIDLEYLEKSILDYLRISIIIGMLMYDKNKKEFISELDKSFYNKKKRNEISKLLDNYYKTFKKCQPITLDKT